MSKFLISEVFAQGNLWTSPLKRLKDNSDVPEARLGIMLKTFTYKFKKNNHGCIVLAFARMGLLVALTQESEDREFVVDSRASMHMIYSWYCGTIRPEINSNDFGDFWN